MKNWSMLFENPVLRVDMLINKKNEGWRMSDVMEWIVSALREYFGVLSHNVVEANKVFVYASHS